LFAAPNQGLRRIPTPTGFAEIVSDDFPVLHSRHLWHLIGKFPSLTIGNRQLSRALAAAEMRLRLKRKFLRLQVMPEVRPPPRTVIEIRPHRWRRSAFAAFYLALFAGANPHVRP
jgi:hypothetical protein